YKYRTTTPSYARNLLASVPDELEEGTDEEKAKAAEVRQKAMLDVGYKSIQDAIVEWDMTDGDGNPVMPSRELFDTLPNEFTSKFMDFLKELVEGNPTNGNGLPHGSPTQPIPTLESVPTGTSLSNDSE